jgi:hypothetical protein
MSIVVSGTIPGNMQPAFVMPRPQYREQEAGQFLKITNVKGGLIVQIDCGDAKLTAAPPTSDS